MGTEHLAKIKDDSLKYTVRLSTLDLTQSKTHKRNFVKLMAIEKTDDS